jgi:cellulose synthase/poly-beta-1,6-N-acetylglucosamine synthase-like glycosyltransferase
MTWAVCGFWFAALLILYTYAGYPLWLWIRSRLFARPWQQRDIYPSISIVLAVHNGGDLLIAKLHHLLTLDYPTSQTEVIVVSDGSCDNTNQVLLTTQHPRLRAFVLSDHVGKAVALNTGIKHAQGEIIVFNDIRPKLEPKALRFLISNFADASVGCVAGQLVLRRDGHDASTAAVGGLYWRYEQRLRAWEAAVDSPLGVYGGFYAVRRELAIHLPEGIILDDMYLPLAIVRQGYRSVYDVRARVWDVWPKTVQGEFARKVRTLAGNLQLLQLAPWLLRSDNRLRFQLVSHKLLRLAVPLLLIACVLTCILLRHSPLYLALLSMQIVVYGLAALGFAIEVPGLKRITGMASAFCLLNAAVIVGIWKFLFVRRPLWRIWVPTRRL